MRVYIIGAGPGDPKLLTLRAQELIESCPVILYTGSLVPKEVLASARADAKIMDTASMTLGEIIGEIELARQRDENVARVHTGDPMLFGSTAEQMRRLRELGIDYEVVPGVSSFTAAAAALGRELTLPEVSQTVILTRAEGRTPVPSGQELASLAGHGATLALFLSINLLAKVCRELIPHYGADCPVAVVHKASCPDQVIVLGTLSTIRERVKAAGITSQSMILIGKVLTCEDFADSRLYAEEFSHGYRRATAPSEPGAAASRAGDGESAALDNRGDLAALDTRGDLAALDTRGDLAALDTRNAADRRQLAATTGDNA